MLQITEYKLDSLGMQLNNEIKTIDDLIKDDLIKISSIKIIESFFTDLEQIIDIKSDFSFVKASKNKVDQLQQISTSINIHNLKPFNQKFKSLAIYLKKKDSIKIAI